MKYPSKNQKDTIIFNDHLRIEGIPSKAYEYIVNGKSAIEWVMERYVNDVDKAFGIRNNCNDIACEHSNPRFILDLVLSIINISIKTVDIVNTLPRLKFDE